MFVISGYLPLLGKIQRLCKIHFQVLSLIYNTYTISKCKYESMLYPWLSAIEKYQNESSANGKTRRGYITVQHNNAQYVRLAQ